LCNKGYLGYNSFEHSAYPLRQDRADSIKSLPLDFIEAYPVMAGTFQINNLLEIGRGIY